MASRIAGERLRQWLHSEIYGLCEPTYEDPKLKDDGTVVLRPFVLYGDPHPGSILLVGYNPTTRVTLIKLQELGISLHDYKEALLYACNFEANVYNRVSGDVGSESHLRFTALIRVLQERFHRSVVMTNCYSYPSAGEKAMSRLL